MTHSRTYFGRNMVGSDATGSYCYNAKKTSNLKSKEITAVLQGQTAVAAYLKSKQLLLFGFVLCCM